MVGVNLIKGYISYVFENPPTVVTLTCSTCDHVQVAAGDEEERTKQLYECFEERAIHLNEEGLVVKDLEGHYVVWFRFERRLLHGLLACSDWIGTRDVLR